MIEEFVLDLIFFVGVGIVVVVMEDVLWVVVVVCVVGEVKDFIICKGEGLGFYSV